MNADYIGIVLVYVLPIVFIILTYFVGSAREKKHFEKIRATERNYLPLTTITTGKRLAFKHDFKEAFLVTGSCVIAPSYFMSTVAGFFNFFGGRISTFENLLDRARRQAILRAKEKALKQNARLIVNLRIETCNLMEAAQNQKNFSIEVFAYATALR